jgi:YHS domain-containing protein
MKVPPSKFIISFQYIVVVIAFTLCLCIPVFSEPDDGEDTVWICSSYYGNYNNARTPSGLVLSEPFAGYIRCPVWGTALHPLTKYTVEYQGKTYYFCGKSCRDEFLHHPDFYSLSPTQKIMYTL